MNPRQLRRRCKAIIREIDIPAPFDVNRLCDSIAARRGRPIDLCGMAMPPESPSGVWVSTAGRDYIFYELRTTQLHQEHIVLHELGHMLSTDRDGGRGSDAPDGCTAQSLLPVPVQAAQLVLPDLDPEVIDRLFHRTAYTEEEERLAELIATSVLALANRWRPVSEWEAPADAAELRRRIHLTIESPRGGRR